MKKLKLLLFCIIALLPLLLAGNVIRVPENHPTIQQAIDATQSGDTVLVADGTYLENIVFPSYPIVVASHFIKDNDPAHIEATVIDGSNPADPDKGTVVNMFSAPDTLSVICGFTIKGGTGTLGLDNDDGNLGIGGGIGIYAGKIINNIIKENTIEGPGLLIGAGIAYGSPFGSGDVVIRGNQIHDNKLFASAWAQGAGMILIPYAGYALVEDNQIFSNSATNSKTYKATGGGIAITKWTSFGGRLIIRNNRIYQNSLHCEVTAGAGIYMFGWFTSAAENYYPTEIYNNLIYDNYSPEMGGGIGVWYESARDHPAPVDPIIYNNTIVNNEARIGAGISNIDAETVLFNNIIWNEKENDQDSEIWNELYTHCPGWCIYVFNGILHSDYNSLSDLDAAESCNNCFPDLDENFCLCSGNYNVGHGITEMTVNGVTYTAPDRDFANNPRPAPIDEFVDIGAIESPFEMGFICVNSTNDQMHPADLQDIMIYPNPATNTIIVELPMEINECQIIIVNMLGKTELKATMGKGSKEIDISNLAKGFHMVNFHLDETVVSRKLIVN